MRFPIIEIVDRYAISVVKHKNTAGANQAELEFYEVQLKLININPINEIVQQLIEHHELIWSLKDKVGQESIEEAGRLAIQIRSQRYVRTELKNKIADLIGDPIREIKQYGIVDTCNKQQRVL